MNLFDPLFKELLVGLEAMTSIRRGSVDLSLRHYMYFLGILKLHS
jgi:hypothetical protein